MKNLIILMTLLIFTNMTNAALVYCETDPAEDPRDQDMHLLYAEKVEGNCYVKDLDARGDNFGKTKDDLHFKITGFGPGLKYIMLEPFLLICPTALAKNLTKHAFYGVKATASAVVIGADVGVFANKKGGTCVLAGLPLGGGAGVSGAKLTFKERTEW